MQRPLLTKVIEWIPQTIALRSGVIVRVRGRSDAKHFWGMFSSPEYMGFLPELASVRASGLTVIDCGASIGLFSLLIEHLRRLEILEWDDVSYVIIEPSAHNIGRLERNIRANLRNGSYHLVEGLVGERAGDSEFYESPWRRVSASVFPRSHFMERQTMKPYIDVGPYLGRGPCVLKLDVEGAEFRFLEVYGEEFAKVRALIVEWHAEHGDVESGRARIVGAGLEPAGRRHTGPNRLVDLYLRPPG